MRPGSTFITLLPLLLLACGSPKSAIYQKDPTSISVDQNDDNGISEHNGTSDNGNSNFTENNGSSDFSEKSGIIVDVSELQGLYPNKEALVKRAQEIGISSCINLDGDARIYSGFGPCIEARTFENAGISPIKDPPKPTPVVTPNPVAPTPVTPNPVTPIVMPPPSSPGHGNTSCGPTPKNVRIVDTGSLGAGYNQTVFRPSPNDVIAFRVTVPAGVVTQSDFRTTVLSNSTTAKLVSVSSCPGDYKNPVGSRGCTKFSYESTRIYMTSNQSASQRSWCVLSPGQTYYMNAVSLESIDGTIPTCSSVSDCGFYAARQPQ